jgi:hypothetical protein
LVLIVTLGELADETVRESNATDPRLIARGGSSSSTNLTGRRVSS